MNTNGNGTMPGRMTLVLGAARSGKSKHAQILAMASPPPWVYIATAEAGDDEMKKRIVEHQRTRGGGWSTVEASIDLAAALAKAPAEQPVVIDCLTLWLSNLMLGGHDVEAATAKFVTALDRRRAPTIIVSNEVGGGIVPDTPLGRDFRDRNGLLNQHLAISAHNVIFMVAGLAMPLKALP